MPIDGKESRRIAAALRILFSKAGIESVRSLSDRAKSDRSIDVLSRLIKLDGGHMIGLSNVGFERLRALVTVLHDSKIWGESIEYSDMHAAVAKMVRDAWNSRLIPETSDEVLQLIRPMIDEIVRSHTFAFPVYGLDREASRGKRIGCAVLHHDLDATVLEGIEYREDDLSTLKQMRGFSWLVLEASGSRKRAERIAIRKASHLMGVLAVAAGCTYEDGASAFRLGVTISPETSLGDSRWAYWTDDRKQLALNIRFARGQRLPVSDELFDRAGGVQIWRSMMSIADKLDLTDLEQGIARAIYWYAEAHRESDPTLQLIKYWSCVEVFFALTEDKISEAVANGLAAMLRYGPLTHPACPPFEAVRKQAKRLYGLRSRALHQGVFDACSARDAAAFSQLTAWMILSIAGLAGRGYTTREEVAKESFRLAVLESRVPSIVTTGLGCSEQSGRLETGPDRDCGAPLGRALS